MAGEDASPPPPPPKVDMNSPFFLGPQDRPGDFITAARFNGENYDEWAGEIETALQARRKFGFLDGTIEAPEAPYTQVDWTVIHAMLVSWIMNTITPEVKTTLSKYKDAKRLWNTLKERFALVNGPRIQQLKSAIARCEQTKTMTVAAYYGKLTALWEELHTHEPLITCACCTKCTAGKDHEIRRNKDMLHEFLMGLHGEYYGQIRSNILSQDPLPSLNRAYQLVVQDERVRIIANQTDDRPEVVGFAVRTGGRGRGRFDRPDRSKLYCNHCKKNGHDVTQCFERVGYPDWWEERAKSDSGTGRGRSRGGISGGGNVRANAAVAENSGAPSTQVFSVDQWKALTSVFGTMTFSNNNLSGKINGKRWIIDTGASNHVTGNLALLTDVKNISCPVGLPDGRKVEATQAGYVRLTNDITLKHVLYVPQLNCNLISVPQLCHDLNSTITFNSSMCAIQDQMRELIGTGSKQDGLYYFKDSSSINAVKVDGDDASLALWHSRMGHPSEKVVKYLPTIRNCRGSLNKACEVCFRAKHPRDTFPLSENKAGRIFELIHVDLWGPYKHKSSCGARYFLTIVDDFSRAVWVYLMVDKTEVFRVFMNFVAMVERQFSQTIKIVRSDNGTEFNCLLEYFSTSGILFQISCVGSPQQNGRVERKHKHLLNVARALRFQANLPIYFWGESVLAAAHLINLTPSSILDYHTPFEKLFSHSPSYDAIRVFGSLCFAHNQKSKGDKFDSRSRKCIFVGYPFGKKGWKLYDLDQNEFFVSRDVKFFEDTFPFHDTKPLDTEVDVDFAEFPNDPTTTYTSHDEEPPLTATPHAESSIPAVEEPDTVSSVPDSPVTSSIPVTVEPSEFHENNNPNGETSSEELLGRGLRVKTPSVLLKDYVAHTVVNKSPSSGTTSPPQHTSGTPYPIAHFIHCDNFSKSYQAFLAAVITGDEPKSFKAAMKEVGWQQAMREEIKALEANSTWTLETLPPGKRALGNQWVYRRKYNSNGTLERLKARLVVFGNHQIEGLDYNETFAPVAKMTTIRTFLAVAASKNWELHQMDVHNAFLHGDLTEEVYMKLPPGFESSNPNMVCRLRKSLYGLKQAPRCWFAKLVTALKKYGFLQSYSDYSLFTYTKGGVQLNVLVYVDDLIISGNNSGALRSFKAYLSDCFRMKDLGSLKYFLGIEVARSSSGLFLCQRKYALDVITETGLLGAKPATFPIEQNHKLSLATSKKLTDPEPYRRLVGRLVYLSVTRPDLAYSVHVLSQFMQEPRQEHWEAALRVVRYLKGTPGQGIMLRANNDLSLQGWCDSDWASCPITRRSLTGWLVFLGKSPISWKTKKQHTVSRSSAEAEYRSMAAITCELKWLKGLLLSLGVNHPQAVPLFCDSESAIHIAQNPVYHERTKHIEVDCHFVRDAITDGLIDPSYVHTKTQLADIFTKALGIRILLAEEQAWHPFRQPLQLLDEHGQYSSPCPLSPTTDIVQS